MLTVMPPAQSKNAIIKEDKRKVNFKTSGFEKVWKYKVQEWVYEFCKLLVSVDL